MNVERTDGNAIKPANSNRDAGLSYKFQRLREKIRAAVASGELSGKLPGERILARRFHVNAKTLSKALTDLAAEGLLDRSIGRGTYVKGSAPSQHDQAGRWLLICDENRVGWTIVKELKAANPNIEVASDLSTMRPSFLRQFSAVIDMGSATPDAFLRDLVVRNVRVVALGRTARTYSTHSVLIDREMGAVRLARELFMAGHSKIAVCESGDWASVLGAVRSAAGRYCPDAVIEACQPEEIQIMIDNGMTAILCNSVKAAETVLSRAEQKGIEIPGQVSLVAVGIASNQYPCTGLFLAPKAMADAIVELLHDAQSHRPTTLWLGGQYVDKHTVASVIHVPTDEQPAERRGLSI